MQGGRLIPALRLIRMSEAGRVRKNAKHQREQALGEIISLKLKCESWMPALLAAMIAYPTIDDHPM